ncbi:MAG: hypothetical protein JST68_03890 [Bacteroidetes bacterium]|nr:hypothetical protein [Bacteroidota bacterium]
MKKISAFFLFAIIIISCNKQSGVPAGQGPNSLFPLNKGNTWYYQDSVFADSNLIVAYADTMRVGDSLRTDGYGNTYTALVNPYGWFGGSYLMVDHYNSTVYEMDPPDYSPYTFFQTVGVDGPIGRGSDYSNPGCPISSIQYGFANLVSVSGYSCYKNAEVVTDCNNVIREEVISYLSPGVGMVRIEDYLSDSAQGNKLYKDYSQTLTNKVLH